MGKEEKIIEKAMNKMKKIMSEDKTVDKAIKIIQIAEELKTLLNFIKFLNIFNAPENEESIEFHKNEALKHIDDKFEAILQIVDNAEVEVINDDNT